MASEAFGIHAIGSYLPVSRQDNFALAKKFNFTEDFLCSKIGVTAPARKLETEETSDLCVKAFEDLCTREAVDPADIDVIVVVTQNPDGHGLPHTSAVVHKKLGLPTRCFAFDISLGCSGFVASLAIVKGYLETTGGARAIVFTADPYSKVLKEDDRNTALIFGDGAAATLIQRTQRWNIGRFDMGTEGQKCDALSVRPDNKLFMNGRLVFDFCAINVPKSVQRTLHVNDLSMRDIDYFAFHPGSKYIVDVLAARLGIAPVPFLAEYGNTVSSSIPFILKELKPAVTRCVLVSGFGVGLSWATAILRSV